MRGEEEAAEREAKDGEMGPREGHENATRAPSPSPSPESLLDDIAHTPAGKLDLSALPQQPAQLKRSFKEYLIRVRILALGKLETLLKEGAKDCKLGELVTLTKELTELQILSEWHDRLSKATERQGSAPSLPADLRKFPALSRLNKLGKELNAAQEGRDVPDWVGDVPE